MGQVFSGGQDEQEIKNQEMSTRATRDMLYQLAFILIFGFSNNLANSGLFILVISGVV